MKYVSTRSHSKTSTFEEVFLKGLAEDGGLFVPQELFKFNQTEINSLKDLNYQDLATEIIFKFTGNFIDKNQLSKLIQKSYSTFRHKNIIDFSDVDEFKIMELFHGPTLAFKDIAMQFIGNLYEYYLNKKQTKINIIVATSGDTGAAAIDALAGKKNLNIFVLHPHNKISSVQRKIMTTYGEKNVFNIAVKGNFDDCQNLVKSMFSDLEFSRSINMSGVNSINWARIIAQSVYYFYAYFKSKNNSELNFSVPTGNFGDIYAGYLAKKIGLPIGKLIVATNKNDILHRAISKGDYKIKKVEETYSPSMDIQIASNFERLLYDLNEKNSEKTHENMKRIKNNDYHLEEDTIKKINVDFLSERLSEDETLKEIRETYNKNKYILDPHTAIGLGVAKKLKINNCIVLATAHPAKFPDAIIKSINQKTELPNELLHINNKKENFEIIDNSLEKIKEYINGCVNEN
tara:strand:+ start:43 stop:1422 length:1380 start_codon:yes stop_codon:yes gene_type:complete